MNIIFPYTLYFSATCLCTREKRGSHVLCAETSAEPREGHAAQERGLAGHRCTDRVAWFTVKQHSGDRARRSSERGTEPASYHFPARAPSFLGGEVRRSPILFLA
eukprot:gene16993-biopygen12845